MTLILQLVLGLALMLVGWALWYAQRNASWKGWIEKTFLLPGDDLFATDQSYSGYIKWIRYVAFPTGLVMFVPTPILYDAIIGMIAAGVFWWMNSQKARHDHQVRDADKPAS